MHELVILSGKGGTGKTSVTASFASLAKNCVLADCDVDAADLHLILQPEIQKHYEFISGNEAVIREADCTGCGACIEPCRFQAIRFTETAAGAKVAEVAPFSCEGCGLCVTLCPEKAIDFPECHCGNWYISKTDQGPLVHARLDPGGENSGRLVTIVREEARQIAVEGKHPILIVDGPPGLGCPVVAAITGADEVLFITEPSVAGFHDLERSIDLAKHFSIPARVCVNRWDLSPEKTEAIEAAAIAKGATVVGRIPWDPKVTKAQIRGRSVVDFEDGPAAIAIRAIWETISSSWKGSTS